MYNYIVLTDSTLKMVLRAQDAPTRRESQMQGASSLSSQKKKGTYIMYVRTEKKKFFFEKLADECEEINGQVSLSM